MEKETESRKNILRNRIRKSSLIELQSMLSELETARFKLENNMMNNQGTSKLTRNYPSSPSPKFGNLKMVKKDIARIKNEMHMRLLRGK